MSKARNGTPDLRESLFLDLFDDVREEWDSRLREAQRSRLRGHAESGDRSGRSREVDVAVSESSSSTSSRTRATPERGLCKHWSTDLGHFLFAVGDDWQSIYRFAGSDISAMTQFEETFGAGHMLRLERTFRSSQELSTLAGDFVMKNPNQLTKKVRSDRSYPAPVELALVDS